MTRAPLVVLGAAFLFAGCGPATPAHPAKSDPTAESWYPQETERLAKMDRAAEQLFQGGHTDDAAAVVSDAIPVQTRLLAAPRPTLEAMQAIADLDQIYGRMLIFNGHFGEARLLLQKNVTRWKIWKPQTPDTERRLKEAADAVAECDRHMGG